MTPEASAREAALERLVDLTLAEQNTPHLENQTWHGPMSKD